MKKIVSLASVALMAIGFSGCGGNVGSGSGKDSSNKVTFESIDSDTFKITLEQNSDYRFASYRITDSDGNYIHLSGLALKGKKFLTCTNSYSSADANTYQCTEESYTFLGKTDKEVKITFYKNKSYIIDMVEYIGFNEKVTHIKTLQGEY